jgi:hypothetical protein
MAQRAPECAPWRHALPAGWDVMRRHLGACPSAGPSPSPPALLRALLLSGGADHSWREVAGTRPLPPERRTAQAGWQRLQRCAPLRKARGQKRRPLDELPAGPQPLRCLAGAGPPVHRPGATSSDARRPRVLHVVLRRWPAIQRTETTQGDRLTPERLPAGEGLVGEHGDCASAGRPPVVT